MGYRIAYRRDGALAVFGHDELLDPLEDEACARLLASTQYGRLAMVVEGRPRIVVLNHTVIAGNVLFRTRDNAVAARLTADGAAVEAVYEVDSAFPVGRSGWSVIAAGRLVREEDLNQQATTRSRLSPWAEGERDLVLRLDVEELTGYRVGPD